MVRLGLLLLVLVVGLMEFGLVFFYLIHGFEAEYGLFVGFLGL